MNPRFEAAWEIHQFELLDEQLPEPHAVADFERAWRAERHAAVKRARKPAKRASRKR